MAAIFTFNLISLPLFPLRCDRVSPGEAQKISLAQLFFHKPSLASEDFFFLLLCLLVQLQGLLYPLSLHAVLDEATFALMISEEDEAHFYTSLQEMGSTVLSNGHRSVLKSAKKELESH